MPATTFTTRLGLRKPDPDPTTGDFITVTTDINNSMDKIDAAIGVTVCTSGTRPTGADRWDGREIYETDTQRKYMWSAALTTWLPLLVGRGTDGPFLLGQSTDTSGEGINSRGSTATSQMWRSRVTTDTNPRHGVQADGGHLWGSGSGTYDTNLYRVSSGLLKTDHTFLAAGGLQVGTNASGVPVKIDQVILSGSQATITLPTSGSIPGTYTSLIVMGSAVGTTASAFVSTGIRFNGVSTAVYDSQQMTGNATTIAAFESINGTSGEIGEMAGSSATGGSSGSFTVFIPFYALTTFWKTYTSSHILSAGTGSTSLRSKHWAGRLRQTGAITTITLVPASGSFAAGTAFSLYAMP